jgi:hypothetical protein
MLKGRNALSLHCVFHGIRFKVNNEDCGCRETTFLFLVRSVNSLKEKQVSYSGNPSTITQSLLC